MPGSISNLYILFDGEQRKSNGMKAATRGETKLYISICVMLCSLNFSIFCVKRHTLQLGVHVSWVSNFCVRCFQLRMTLILNRINKKFITNKPQYRHCFVPYAHELKRRKIFHRYLVCSPTNALRLMSTQKFQIDNRLKVTASLSKHRISNCLFRIQSNTFCAWCPIDWNTLGAQMLSVHGF